MKKRKKKRVKRYILAIQVEDKNMKSGYRGEIFEFRSSKKREQLSKICEQYGIETAESEI